MRVVTFNVRYGTAKEKDEKNQWEFRRELLLETIGILEPDILGVQECQPFQGDEISTRFPYFGRVGFGRYHGVLVDRPHENYSGEHCDIYFDSRKYLANNCGTFWHSDTPEVPGSISWGNSLARITTFATLEAVDGPERFTILNTHLHSNQPYLANTTDLLVTRVTSLAGDSPCILIGDFNAVAGDEIYRRLTENGDGCAGLVDVWNALGHSETDAGTAHNWTGVPDTRIDWVLTTRGITPLSIEVFRRSSNGRFPSDHYPVVAELGIG